jgi:hypothetical protein
MHTNATVVQSLSDKPLALAWPFFNRRGDRYSFSDKLRNISGAL